jgi:hypothetical protein
MALFGILCESAIIHGSSEKPVDGDDRNRAIGSVSERRKEQKPVLEDQMSEISNSG